MMGTRNQSKIPDPTSKIPLSAQPNGALAAVVPASAF